METYRLWFHELAAIVARAFGIEVRSAMVINGLFVVLSIGAAVLIGLFVPWMSRAVEPVGIENKTGGFVQVSAGDHYNCAVHKDGYVVCWENVGRISTDVPEGDYKTVRVTHRRACAIRVTGALECWRRNFHAPELPPTLPVDAPSGEFTDVSLGVRQDCALRTNGRITCWTTSDQEVPDPDGRYVALSVGFGYGCAIEANTARIVCWGDADAETNVPLGRYTDIAVDIDERCALHEDGRVLCWTPEAESREVHLRHDGEPHIVTIDVNSFAGFRCGMLSTGEVRCSPDSAPAPWDLSPSDINLDGRYVSFSIGFSHICGVHSQDGTVECPGDGRYGQTVPPTGHYTDVSAGNSHACALHVDGHVDCWGRNHYGQATAPSGRYANISVGGQHSCAIAADTEQVKCWGSALSGQLNVPDGRFRSIASGSSHACAIDLTDEIKCWGNSAYGTTTPPPGRFQAISAYHDSSCAIRAVDGGVHCWGYIPPGDDVPANDEPPSRGAVAVSGGTYYGCALLTSGALTCWGINTTTDSAGQPVEEVTYTHVSVAEGHMCALDHAGEVRCFGGTNFWQPKPPSGRYSALASAYRYDCAIDAGTQELVCWGYSEVAVPGTFVFTVLMTSSELPGRRRGGRIRVRQLRNGAIEFGWWFTFDGEPAETVVRLRPRKGGRRQWRYSEAIVRDTERWGWVCARQVDEQWIECGFQASASDEDLPTTVLAERLPLPLTGDVDGWTDSGDGWLRGREIVIDRGEIDWVAEGEPLGGGAGSTPEQQSTSGGVGMRWVRRAATWLGSSRAFVRQRQKVQGEVWATRRARRGKRRRRGRR